METAGGDRYAVRYETASLLDVRCETVSLFDIRTVWVMSKIERERVWGKGRSVRMIDKFGGWEFYSIKKSYR